MNRLAKRAAEREAAELRQQLEASQAQNQQLQQEAAQAYWFADAHGGKNAAEWKSVSAEAWVR